MKNWKNIIVSPDVSLREAIECIDASGIQLALVVGESMKLLGVLTDGDIRRAILNGFSLTEPVTGVMNRSPKTASIRTSQEEVLAMMRRYTFHHLPLVDDEGKVAGLATLDDFLGVVERDNWVVLMAGGLGSRLRPLTDSCPKPLLNIGGKPILENIVEAFIEQGFRKFFISVNYRAEMIKEYFGTGERWGAQIEYLHEPERLGTAGALSLLKEKPEAPIIVMNADLITKANFGAMLRFHEEHDSAATMAVREYDFQVPYGVVKVEGARILGIEEKPVQSFFVNAGIYILSAAALNSIPQQVFFDMPSLFQNLNGEGEKVSAYPLREYWLDIGRIEEYERAQREWG